MKHILGTEGQAALQSLLDTRALLAFDFDGTLAPIVADPKTARSPLPVARALRTLAQWWPIAVITGRAVADMSERLGFEPYLVVGSHGAEDPTSPDAVDPSRLDEVRIALESEAGQVLRQAGVVVEDKGQSMALHYRLARDREGAREAALLFVQGLGESIATFEGKMVLNIVVAGAPHKGDAVLGLARRLGAESVFFVGDDVNDEPVFRCAAPNWVTIKVGREPHSAARFFLDSSAEMAVLLDLCVKLSQRPAGGPG
jgi:trehalose 6-phosphate phosphatase